MRHFLIKKKIGASVYGVEKYFKLIQTFDDTIAIPRGFLNNLLNFLKENNLEFDVDDKRLKLKDITFENNIKLLPYQFEAVEKAIASIHHNNSLYLSIINYFISPDFGHGYSNEPDVFGIVL